MKERKKGENSPDVNSLYSLLYPRSVALIGASRYPGTIGYLILQCIVQGGFSGTIYPVNPNTESVMSIKTYPSVLDIPGDVDLAVEAAKRASSMHSLGS